jgi:CheY-like chemotaxis protein
VNCIERKTRNSYLIREVDDEDLVRDMILQGVKQAGYNCIAAGNGNEALNLMEKIRLMSSLPTSICPESRG